MSDRLVCDEAIVGPSYLQRLEYPRYGITYTLWNKYCEIVRRRIIDKDPKLLKKPIQQWADVMNMPFKHYTAYHKLSNLLRLRLYDMLKKNKFHIITRDQIIVLIAGLACATDEEFDQYIADIKITKFDIRKERIANNMEAANAPIIKKTKYAYRNIKTDGSNVQEVWKQYVADIIKIQFNNAEYTTGSIDKWIKIIMYRIGLGLPVKDILTRLEVRHGVYNNIFQKIISDFKTKIIFDHKDMESMEKYIMRFYDTAFDAMTTNPDISVGKRNKILEPFKLFMQYYLDMDPI